MTGIRDSGLAVERHDIFDVTQLTRDTDLERLVAADLVNVAPGEESQIHRHNQAETVLFFLDGTADIVVGDDVVPVVAGDRVRIARGVFHGVRTGDRPLRFLSVQCPPILDTASGTYDLEPRDQAAP